MSGVPKWVKKLEDEALAAGEKPSTPEPRCAKTGSTAPCPADQSGCPEC